MDMSCRLITISADLRVLFTQFIKFPLWSKPKEKLLIGGCGIMSIIAIYLNINI